MTFSTLTGRTVVKGNDAGASDTTIQRLQTASPTTSPTYEQVEEFCPNGNYGGHFECIENLVPQTEVTDCAAANEVLAAAYFCVEQNCGIVCENIVIYAEFDIDLYNEELGCDLGPACSQTFAPTMFPTVDPTTSAPTIAGVSGGPVFEASELVTVFAVVTLLTIIAILLAVCLMICSLLKKTKQEECTVVEISQQVAGPDNILL